jgi:hypothetical protein
MKKIIYYFISRYLSLNIFFASAIVFRCEDTPKLKFHVNHLRVEELNPDFLSVIPQSRHRSGDLTVKALVAHTDKVMQGTILHMRNNNLNIETCIYEHFRRL